MWKWIGAATVLALFAWLRRRAPMIVVGHRGAAGLAPENTLVSLRTALDLGTHWVECDVQQTSDGVIMIMHDATLDRTTNGSGSIAATDWATISALDAGSWKGAQFAGERVPRLDEALRLTGQYGATLCIEVKDPQLYPGISENLAQVIRDNEATERVVIISFDLDWLRRFSESAPDIPVGSLWVSMGDPETVPSARLIDIHWRSLLSDPSQLWRARMSGRKLAVWTVNDPLVAALLYAVGVDGITTDRADLILPVARQTEQLLKLVNPDGVPA
jgi:glycerophosphoryl diester phosphodiesterase